MRRLYGIRNDAQTGPFFEIQTDGFRPHCDRYRNQAKHRRPAARLARRRAERARTNPRWRSSAIRRSPRAKTRPSAILHFPKSTGCSPRLGSTIAMAGDTHDFEYYREPAGGGRRNRCITSSTAAAARTSASEPRSRGRTNPQQSTGQPIRKRQIDHETSGRNAAVEATGSRLDPALWKLAAARRRYRASSISIARRSSRVSWKCGSSPLRGVSASSCTAPTARSVGAIFKWVGRSCPPTRPATRPSNIRCRCGAARKHGQRKRLCRVAAELRSDAACPIAASAVHIPFDIEALERRQSLPGALVGDHDGAGILERLAAGDMIVMMVAVDQSI